MSKKIQVEGLSKWQAGAVILGIGLINLAFWGAAIAGAVWIGVTVYEKVKS